MNPKRVAGFLNILLGVVAMYLGYAKGQSIFYLIAAFMFLIGFLRLRRTPPA